MRTSISIVAAVFTLLTAACASTSSTTAAIREGDQTTLNRDCKLLGTVTGRDWFGGMTDRAKTQVAMNDARAKAAEMGGTHVVFLQTDAPTILNTWNVEARAYHCEKAS